MVVISDFFFVVPLIAAIIFLILYLREKEKCNAVLKAMEAERRNGNLSNELFAKIAAPLNKPYPQNTLPYAVPSNMPPYVTETAPPYNGAVVQQPIATQPGPLPVQSNYGAVSQQPIAAQPNPLPVQPHYGAVSQQPITAQPGHLPVQPNYGPVSQQPIAAQPNPLPVQPNYGAVSQQPIAAQPIPLPVQPNYSSVSQQPTAAQPNYATVPRQPVTSYRYDPFPAILPDNIPQKITPPKPPKVKQPFNPSNTILIIGVLFILISGLIFATTSWQTLADPIKAITIFGVSIVFFAAFIIADKVLKIEKSALAFFCLTAVFLPLAIVAAGYLNLFGNWLSFAGSGRFLLSILIVVPFMLCSMYGGVKFKNLFFQWLSLICISLIAFFTVAAFYPSRDVFIFAMTLYGLVVFAVSEWLLPRIAIESNELARVLLPKCKLFAMLNIYLFALVSTFIAGTGAFGAITSIALAAVFLVYSTVHARSNALHGYLFSALLVVGLVKLYSGEEFSATLLMLSLSAIIVFVIGMLDIIPDFVKKVLTVSTIVIMSLAFAASLVFAVVTSGWTIPLLGSMFICMANSVLLVLRAKNKIAQIFLPFTVLALISGGSSLFIPANFVPFAIPAMLFIAFAIFFLLDKRAIPLRSIASDLCIAVPCLLYSFSLWRNPMAMFMSFLFAFLILLTVCFENKSTKLQLLFRYVLPYSAGLLTLPAMIKFPEVRTLIALAFYLTICALSTLLLFVKDENRLKKVVEKPFFAATLATVLLFLIPYCEKFGALGSHYILYLAFFWILAASLIIRRIVQKTSLMRKELSILSVIVLHIAVICTNRELPKSFFAVVLTLLIFGLVYLLHAKKIHLRNTVSDILFVMYALFYTFYRQETDIYMLAGILCVSAMLVLLYMSREASSSFNLARFALPFAFLLLLYPLCEMFGHTLAFEITFCAVISICATLFAAGRSRFKGFADFTAPCSIAAIVSGLSFIAHCVYKGSTAYLVFVWILTASLVARYWIESKRNLKLAKELSILSIIAVHVAIICTNQELPKSFFAVVLTLLIFGIVYLLHAKKIHLRNTLSDILFVLYALFYAFYRQETDIYMLAGILCVSTMLVLLYMSREQRSSFNLARFALPFAFLLLLYPLCEMFGHTLVFEIAFCAVISICATLFAAGRSRFKGFADFTAPCSIAAIVSGLSFIAHCVYKGGNAYLVFVWILTASLAVRCWIESKQDSKSARILFYISASTTQLAVFLTTWELLGNDLFIALGVSFLVPAALSVLSLCKGFTNPYKADFSIISAILLNITLFFMTACVCFEQLALPRMILLFAAAAYITALLHLQKRSVFAFLPLLAGILTIYCQLPYYFAKTELSLVLILTLIFAAFTALGRLLYKTAFANEPTRVDWFSLAALSLTPMIAGLQIKNSLLLVFVLLAILMLCQLNKFTSKNSNNVIGTASAGFLAIAIAVQEFFVVPPVLSLEFILLPIGLFLFAVCNFLWRDYRKNTELIGFISGILFILILAFSAIGSNLAADAVILGLLVVGVFIASFIRRNRKWFILSSVTLIALGIYMSKEFWSSLAWWVYLLAVGVLFIIIATVSEVNKRKSVKPMDSITKVFKDWK